MEMLARFVLVLLCLFVSAGASVRLPNGQTVLDPNTFKDASNIVKALKDAEIIKDVLPSNFTPTVALNLAYRDSEELVNLGNTIPVPSTSSQPHFSFKNLQIDSLPLADIPTKTVVSNHTLTLVLSDPDATSRADPVKGQMCHWIVTNIHAHHYYVPIEEADETGPLSISGLAEPRQRMAGKPHHLRNLVEYMQPAPPPKTGKHRYVFVLLAPKVGEKDPQDPKKPKERPHFGYGEMGKGVMDWAKDNGLVPIGANFFYAEHEGK